MKRGRLAASALAALLAAGCGSTAEVRSTGQVGQGGEFSSPGGTGPGGTGTSLGGPDAQASSGAFGPGSGNASGPMGSAPGGGPGSSTGGSSSGNVGSAARPKSISIGLLAADYTKLVASVGGSDPGDPQAANRALVKALNAHGGLAGRHIDPVYYTIDGTQADYSSQEQAACATFTQDHHVEAVVGGGGDSTLYACLLKAGVPILEGGPSEALDETEWRNYPNVFNPPGLAVDRQGAAFMQQSIETGWLTPKNKLGVIHPGCAWGQRSYDQVVVPAAKSHGIVVEDHSLGCPADGAGSLGPSSSEIQSAVLQFRSDGVDRVMILAGNLDAASYVLFTKNADSQHWYPGYIVGSNAVAEGWVAGGVVSTDQAANTREVGWVPIVDVGNPPLTAQLRACDALVESGGAPKASPPGVYGPSCDSMLVLRAALVSDGGVGGLSALRPAIEALGTSYVGAANINGGIRLAPDRHDGVYLVAMSAYQASCKCFHYMTKTENIA